MAMPTMALLDTRRLEGSSLEGFTEGSDEFVNVWLKLIGPSRETWKTEYKASVANPASGEVNRAPPFELE